MQKVTFFRDFETFRYGCTILTLRDPVKSNTSKVGSFVWSFTDKGQGSILSDENGVIVGLIELGVNFPKVLSLDKIIENYGKPDWVYFFAFAETNGRGEIYIIYERYKMKLTGGVQSSKGIVNINEITDISRITFNNKGWVADLRTRYPSSSILGWKGYGDYKFPYP